MNVLKNTGLYGIIRNPQALTCSFAVIGYALLYFSWHSLGWVVTFMIIVHIMVLTEEELLLNIHGEEYKDYCRRVPRYIGLSPSRRFFIFGG